MTRFVVGDDRSQSTLFPERLDDYLSEDNPMERRNNGFQVLADEDRFGADLSLSQWAIYCKLSAKDSGGDLWITTPFERRRPSTALSPRSGRRKFFVREGEFVFQVGEDVFRLKPGDSVFGPRNVPHAFANVSDTGRLMIVYQPADAIEQFFS